LHGGGGRYSRFERGDLIPFALDNAGSGAVERSNRE
jgi:hypothetical protein